MIGLGDQPGVKDVGDEASMGLRDTLSSMQTSALWRPAGLSMRSDRCRPPRERECAAPASRPVGASAVAQVPEFCARSPTTAAMIGTRTHAAVHWWVSHLIFVGSLSFLAGIHAP